MEAKHQLEKKNDDSWKRKEDKKRYYIAWEETNEGDECDIKTYSSLFLLFDFELID